MNRYAGASSYARRTADRPLNSFRGKALIRALVASCAIYLAFFGIACLLASDGGDSRLAMVLVHFGAAASFLAYWRLGRWGTAKYGSFGAALLLVSAIFRFQAAFDTITFGMRIEAIPNTVPLTDPVMFWLLKGELLTQAGVLMVVSAWRVSMGRRIEEFSFLRNYRGAPIRLLAFAYTAGLAVNLVGQFAPDVLGPFQQLASLMFSFSVAAIYFIAARQGKVRRQVAVALLLAMPMVVLALGLGVKESLFFPLVPAALLYWFGYRSLALRVLLAGFVFFALALSQLYVGYVRANTWQTNSADTSALETLSGFGDEFGSMGMLDGLEQISFRINMTSAHAITVCLADRYGYEPFEVFGLIPASVVPRILWPGKPVLRPGAMQTARIRGVRGDLADISSATAAGFSTELYLGGGVLGVFLGAGLYGLLLAGAQKWVLRMDPGFGHEAFTFMAMYWTLRFDEKAVVYAYTSIMFIVVYIWLMKKVAAGFGLRSRVAGDGGKA